MLDKGRTLVNALDISSFGSKFGKVLRDSFLQIDRVELAFRLLRDVFLLKTGLLFQDNDDSGAVARLSIR